MTEPSPTTPITQVSGDQAVKVSFNERLKYSLTIQKPASLTCPPKTLPAPTDNTINAGLTPADAINGATKPAPVKAATVDDPRLTRSSAVISQAASSGDIFKSVNI